MKYGLGDNTFFEEDVPNFIMDSIQDEIDLDDWKDKSYNHGLAGNIKKEYLLEHCFEDVADFVEQKAYEYKGEKYKLDNLWINFMEKYEFNPFHTHSGDLSFVIFVKIPFTFEEESEVFKGCQSPCAGMFAFQYCDILGNIAEHQIELDSLYENKMFMFPSKLRHGVYPFFTSDEYRITVAGNLIKA